MIASADVFRSILFYLNSPSVSRLGLVNWQFNKWCQDERVWKHLLEKEYPHLPSSCCLFGDTSPVHPHRLFQLYQSKTNLFLNRERTLLISSNDDSTIVGTIIGCLLAKGWGEMPWGNGLTIYESRGNKVGLRSTFRKRDPFDPIFNMSRDRIEYRSQMICDPIASRKFDMATRSQIKAICDYYQVKFEEEIVSIEKDAEKTIKMVEKFNVMSKLELNDHTNRIRSRLDGGAEIHQDFDTELEILMRGFCLANLQEESEYIMNPDTPVEWDDDVVSDPETYVNRMEEVE